MVGDDDQSIYKFRGANIHNILNFESAFPNAKVIKLEQNYRSTKNILSAANHVIANNTSRKDKSLWTDKVEGENIKYTTYLSDLDEAESISNTIENIYKSGKANLSDIAILYRTNAQSRVFEDKLVKKNIPYKIIGGINFYSRKEVKDIIAYLKTIDNGLDSVAVKRIINVPRRGIGITSVDKIDSYVNMKDITFYEGLKASAYIPEVSRALKKITGFVSLIEGLKTNLQNPNYDLTNIIDDILEGTGYLKDLQLDGSDEAKDRIENINELINTLAYYNETSQFPTLSGFLEEIALIADVDNLDNSSDYVVLMTLHSSKGLEFPHVFLCGMDEGIFPSYMSINSDNPAEEIEEERRLCYVGITRAMDSLYISSARERMIRGEFQYLKPSRFIHEIPPYLLHTKPLIDSFTSKVSTKPTYFYKKDNYKPYSSKAKHFGDKKLESLDYNIGDTVKHAKFGLGKVLEIVKGGKDFEVTINFENYGIKKLLSSFANLTFVE